MAKEAARLVTGSFWQVGCWGDVQGCTNAVDHMDVIERRCATHMTTTGRSGPQPYVHLGSEWRNLTLDGNGSLAPDIATKCAMAVTGETIVLTQVNTQLASISI